MTACQPHHERPRADTTPCHTNRPPRLDLEPGGSPSAGVSNPEPPTRGVGMSGSHRAPADEMELDMTTTQTTTHVTGASTGAPTGAPTGDAPAGLEARRRCSPRRLGHHDRPGGSSLGRRRLVRRRHRREHPGRRVRAADTALLADRRRSGRRPGPQGPPPAVHVRPHRRRADCAVLRPRPHLRVRRCLRGHADHPPHRRRRDRGADTRRAAGAHALTTWLSHRRPGLTRVGGERATGPTRCMAAHSPPVRG